MEKFITPAPLPTAHEQEILHNLIEECAEVIQRGTKLLRFGADEVQPGKEHSNRERLSLEIGNVICMVENCVRLGLVDKSIVGQRIAIHAGKRSLKQREVSDLIARLQGPTPWEVGLDRDLAIPLLERIVSGEFVPPSGAIVCSGILGEPVKASEILSEFGDVKNDSDRDDHFNWAWPIERVMAVVPSIPADGRQGFWNTKGDIS